MIHAQIQVETILRLAKLTGSPPIFTAEQVIDRAVEVLSVEFRAHVGGHHENTSGDLRGSGRPEAREAIDVARGDSSAGSPWLGIGSGERGENLVRGESQKQLPESRAVPCEGGPTGVLDHCPLIEKANTLARLVEQMAYGPVAGYYGQNTAPLRLLRMAVEDVDQLTDKGGART